MNIVYVIKTIIITNNNNNIVYCPVVKMIPQKQLYLIVLFI